MKTVLVLAFIATVAFGSDMDKVENALKHNDYNKAYLLLKPLAKSGNPDAQFQLSILYTYGKGTKIDTQKALKLLRDAATQDQVNAQYTLAVNYCYGDSVAKNLAQCAKWANKAKDNGKDVNRLWDNFKLNQYLKEEKMETEK